MPYLFITGQVPAHELPGSFGQHVEPVQEPSPIRQPEDRVHVRGLGQKVLPANGRLEFVGKYRL